MSREYHLKIKYPFNGNLDLDEKAIEIAQLFSGECGDSGTGFRWRDLGFSFQSVELGEQARREFVSEGFLIRKLQVYY